MSYVPSDYAPYGCCPDCGEPLPNPWTDECRHRRACEARQMLQAGAPTADAAAHAQNLRGDR
jgi:transposase